MELSKTAVVSAGKFLDFMPSKEEYAEAFVPMESCTFWDWPGTLIDLFSPDDANPNSRRFIDLDDASGELQVSADTGTEKWGRRFDSTTSVNPVLAATANSNTRKTNFLSKIPTDAPIYAEAKAGALSFTLVLGTAFGKKVIKWNGLYDGKGGTFAGKEVSPCGCDNFWEYTDVSVDVSEVYQTLMHQFQSVDRAKDGTLAQSDLVRMFQSQGLAQAGELLASSGFANSGRVPYAEFLAWALGVPPLVSRTISPLHHLDADLQNRGKADDPGAVGAFYEPGYTHVIRVVLTGGPCGGKSSALEHLITSAKAEGFDVYTAPETATLIFNSGFGFPPTDDDNLNFQTQLLSMQLQMEKAFTKLAAKTGRPSIIVFDRGLMDSKGYIKEELWKQVLENLWCNNYQQKGVTEEYLLHRYDAVVHLVTAADGAEKFYKWGKTVDDSGKEVIRHESPEQARELDSKMRSCWSDHPRHIIVRNAGSFRDKMQAVSDGVLKVAFDKHPSKQA